MTSRDQTPVAVLLGGGVESTLLVKQFLAAGERVVPIHIRCGLRWDACEAAHVQRFCAAQGTSQLLPLIEFQVSLTDFLGKHWAVSDRAAPPAGAAAGDLEIPLRNLLLLGLAVHKLFEYPRIALALGTTVENCYRDGSRGYFDLCEQLLTLEAGRPVQVLTPFISWNKTQVIRASDQETLGLSFSCVDPQGDRHCGRCIKCGKRRAAFQTAGVVDPTCYAANPGDRAAAGATP